MPALKNKKIVSPRQPLLQRKSFWLLAVPLTLLVSGMDFLVIQHNQNRKAIEGDRARFEQVDKDVQSVAAEIIAQIGQPLSARHDKGCSRPSAKWENVPLSCKTERALFYKVENPAEANGLDSTIKQIREFGWSRINATTSHNTDEADKFIDFNLSDSSDYQSLTTSYFSHNASMHCDISRFFYLASNPPFDDFFVSNDSVYLLGIIIDCRDEAQAEFFTLID